MSDPIHPAIGGPFLTSLDGAIAPGSCPGPLHCLNGEWQDATKRTMDIVFAALLLTVLVTVMLVIALAIRLETPGPALFRQRRIGLANTDFEMWKFRTMHPHASAPGSLVQTTRNDPRVTHVGAFLGALRSTNCHSSSTYCWEICRSSDRGRMLRALVPVASHSSS